MQEEIREGIQPWVDNRFGEGNLFNTQVLYDFLVYLHSKGVVIKVDRELPENRYKKLTDLGDAPWWIGYENGQDDMVEAGYTAVESLIKEVKDGQV